MRKLTVMPVKMLQLTNNELREPSASGQLPLRLCCSDMRVPMQLILVSCAVVYTVSDVQPGLFCTCRQDCG